eukprot:SAG31_NODE_212_length_20157_cov_9.648868_18_plen_371_part_00
MADAAPGSIQELLNWIRSPAGPGRDTTTRALDAQFRADGVPGFSSVPAAAWGDHNTATVWLVIERNCSTIKFSDILIGPTAYLSADADPNARAAAAFNWWHVYGAKFANRIGREERFRRAGSKLSKDESAGRVLSSPECGEIYESRAFVNMRGHIARDDLSQAIAALDGLDEDARRLRRALLYIRQADGLQISPGDTERQAVYTALRDLDALLDAAVEGEILTAFVHLKNIPDSLIRDVREQLGDISRDPERLLQRGTAAVLGCEVKELHKKQYEKLRPALQCVGQILNLTLGTAAGNHTGRNLQAVVHYWAVEDATFTHWPGFAPSDEPAASEMIKTVLVTQSPTTESVQLCTQTSKPFRGTLDSLNRS